MPLVNVLNATYFESDYFEEDAAGVVQRRNTQADRFHPEYSARTYGHGGLLPRTVSQALKIWILAMPSFISA